MESNKDKDQKTRAPEGTSGHSKLQLKKTANISQIYSKKSGGHPEGVSGHSSLKQLSVKVNQIKKS
jgi:hypothetical protein